MLVLRHHVDRAHNLSSRGLMHHVPCAGSRNKVLCEMSPIKLLGLFGFNNAIFRTCNDGHGHLQQTVLFAESAISVKVDNEDASRIQSIMDRSSVKVADRAAAYRKSGWANYNASANLLPKR